MAWNAGMLEYWVQRDDFPLCYATRWNRTILGFLSLNPIIPLFQAIVLLVKLFEY
jgi:hypothetical protein